MCVCVCMLLYIYVAWCLILNIALCAPNWVSALGYLKFKIPLQWAVVGESLRVSILQCCPQLVPDTGVIVGQYLEAPTVVAEEGSVLARVGDSVQLRCSALGKPAPVIRWAKDDDQIITSSKYEVSITTSRNPPGSFLYHSP